MCSLCREMKEARPLDLSDPIFGSYVRLLRMSGISHHNEQLGICGDCYGKYQEMQKRYHQKQMAYLVLAVVFGALYLYLTQNPALSLLIALFMFSLSLFNYVPPLEWQGGSG